MENGKDTAIFDLRNQIYCMDYMELMAHIPNGFVSLILTDPPYGISYQNHFARQPHKRLDGDCGIDYERFAWESYRILRDNSHAYFFTRFDCYPYHYDCLQKAGFTVKNCLVVEKGTVGGIGDLKGSFANNAEWIIFCQKGRRVFQQTQLLENRYKEGTQFHKGRKPSKKYKTRFPACWFGAEYPKATYHAIWQKQNGIYHPTVKSVEFLSWLIQISSTTRELVFDGFMGTGSTALAALRNNRDYLGAEIDREYFAVAQNGLRRYLNMSNIRFRSAEHQDFFLENMMKCRVNDCYHRAFFYVMGIAGETRNNINRMFDFKNDCIVPEGMHGGWQTSGTVKVCHLAFNLWNGYAEEGRERYFTPEELFCCEFAPYFMEGIKVRYPEYCRDLPTPKQNKDYAR